MLDWNLGEQSVFLYEKAALATPSWQTQERLYVSFSLALEMGIFLVVSDAVSKNLPFIKEKLCCGLQMAQLWLASTKTISCMQ